MHVALLMLACVVHYGEPPEGPVPDGDGVADVAVDDSSASPERRARPDYAGLEQELLNLAESDPDIGVDRNDRLMAAQELTVALRRPRADADAAVEAYLRRLIEIESRALADEPVAFAEEGVTFGGSIAEEELGIDTSDVPPAEVLPPEEAETAARAALAEDDYRRAIQVLEPHKDAEVWPTLAPVWSEAVDGWVHEERERAGQLFLDARALPEAQRGPAVHEVLGILNGLVEDYPESSYRAAIERNIELVERELPKE
ncbi:MAG: hypothetical protein H6739_38050 [Alphaproteobacteria bacterium]|nr:hypothetical protein [Alphaproteobacteria bacterium]